MTTPARKRLMRDFKRADMQIALGDMNCFCNICIFICRLHTALSSLKYSLIIFPSFAGLQSDPPEGVNACPRAENIMQWKAVIFGPEGTIWDGTGGT